MVEDRIKQLMPEDDELCDVCVTEIFFINALFVINLITIHICNLFGSKFSKIPFKLDFMPWIHSGFLWSRITAVVCVLCKEYNITISTDYRKEEYMQCCSKGHGICDCCR